MIPLKDDNPTRTFPLITLLIIAANLSAFAYERTLSPPALERLIFSFGAVPRHFGLTLPEVRLPPPAAWISLFTSMFLHAGYLHVGGNMLYLWIFGDNIEDAMGHLRFLVFYLICGATAGLVQVAAVPSSRVPLVGASGAIAGVLGAYILLYPAARIRTLVIFILFIRIVSVPAAFILGFWFLMQVLSAPDSGGTGVAFFAHIGGFLTGMLLVFVFARIRLGRAP
jgi:rhomboid family protein